MSKSRNYHRDRLGDDEYEDLVKDKKRAIKFQKREQARLLKHLEPNEQYAYGLGPDFRLKT